MLDWMVINPIPTGVIGLIVFGLIYAIIRFVSNLFMEREQI